MDRDTNYKFEKKIIHIARSRLVFTLIIIFSIFVGIFSQLLSFSFISTKETNNTLNIASDALRNDILDRNNNILATNLPSWSIIANPKQVVSPIEEARLLSEIMPEKNEIWIYKKLTKPKTNYVEIDRKASAFRFQQILNSGVTGLHFKKINSRIYPMGNSAAHIIGNVNRDGNGISGIERVLNNQLKKSEFPVKLTLDIRVQNVVEKELTRQIKFFEAVGGAGLVLNIDNGEILASASLPSYNLNEDLGKISEVQRFNKVTFGTYEMGSIFKLFNTAIALDSGKIKIEDKFDTTKPFYIGKYPINDFHALEDPANIATILIESSNIGSALIAKEFGPKIQKHYFDLLGLTSKPKLTLPEVASPSPQKNHQWNSIRSLTMAYGHGIAVSPIQLASAVGAVMNGGFYVKPKLILENKHTLPKIVFKAETSDILRSFAREIVMEGTGKKANARGYYVGGKTGTAEKISSSGGYNKKSNLASFVGIFPIYNPKYLVLVMIDEPKPQLKKLGHSFTTGGHVAAPVVKEIITKSAPLLNVLPLDINSPKIKHVNYIQTIVNQLEFKNESF